MAGRPIAGGAALSIPRGDGSAREARASDRSTIGSDQAERIGLVSRVMDDDALLETAVEIAEQMCGFSTHGLAMTKEVLWSAIDLENRNQLLVRMTTQNLDGAIRARRDGRAPVYED